MAFTKDRKTGIIEPTGHTTAIRSPEVQGRSSASASTTHREFQVHAQDHHAPRLLKLVGQRRRCSTISRARFGTVRGMIRRLGIRSRPGPLMHNVNLQKTRESDRVPHDQPRNRQARKQADGPSSSIGRNVVLVTAATRRAPARGSISSPYGRLPRVHLRSDAPGGFFTREGKPSKRKC